MAILVGPSEDRMSALSFGYLKNLCKQQAAQIDVLNAQVAIHQEHIARLEAYISKLETDEVSTSLSSLTRSPRLYADGDPLYRTSNLTPTRLS